MKFSDWIFEMAYRQSRAIEKIEDLLPMVSIHILKCELMPDSIDGNHWLSEIKNWFRKINDFSFTKTKSGKISYKVFEKEFGIKLETRHLKKYVEEIEDEYEEFDALIIDKAVLRTQEILKWFFKVVSEDTYSWKEFKRKFSDIYF